MIINGLEELSEEQVKKMNLDNLQYLLLILGELEPVKALGIKVHIGNIKEDEDLSFELDNGKELIEIHINVVKSMIYITIYKDIKALHYLYNINKKKFVNEEVFLHNDNLILKYHVKNQDYFFELYNYENTSDTRLFFKANNFDVDSFVNKFFIEEDHLDEMIKILPKDYLKIEQITLDYEREILYQDNKLVRDYKGEYDEEGRKER